jgi:hypothetical protein
MKTDPVSETPDFLVSRITDDGQNPKTQQFWAITVVREIYNGAVYTTIFLKKKLRNRYYPISSCLLVANGNATCFDPFLCHFQAYKNIGASS